MKSNKNFIFVVISIVSYLVFRYYFTPYGPDTYDDALANTLSIILSYIGMMMLVAWCYSIHKRILNPYVHNYLLNTGICLVFWFLIRSIKYWFIPTFTFYHRFSWYLYYVPMLLIPVFGALIVDYIGKPESYVAKNKKKLLYIPTIILIIIVLTNDFHQLVFTFPEGIENYHTTYGYNIFQIINIVWIVILGLYFVISLIIKNRISGKKFASALPLIILLAAVVFWVLYSLGIFNTDLVETDCIIIVLLLESTIALHQIRSNIGYQEIFFRFSDPVWIVDKKNNIIYKSQIADNNLEKDLIKEVKEQNVSIGNTLLQCRKISAGWVIWATDVAHINSIIEQLKDTEREISDENSLLNKEILLKRQKAHYDEQNMLFDQITQEIQPHLNRIDALSKRAENYTEDEKEVLAKISCIGAYIKRKSNLRILSYENDMLESKELELCFKESCNTLMLTSSSVLFKANCIGFVPTQNAIKVYDIFENILEDNIDNINAFMVDLNTEDGGIYVKLNMGLNDSFINSKNYNEDNVRFHVDDYDVTAEIFFDFGGDVK